MSQLLAILLIPLYPVPLIVALSRKHNQAGPIAVINILLGWTLVGWVVAMAWSVSSQKKHRALIADIDRPKQKLSSKRKAMGLGLLGACLFGLAITYDQSQISPARAPVVDLASSENIAPEAWAPVTQQSLPETYARLGHSGVAQANDWGRAAAKWFATKCQYVENVNVSDRATSKNIVFFANCRGENAARHVSVHILKDLGWK